MRSLTTLTLFLCLGAAAGAEPLIIHEWGTFTSLQDSYATTIGGINTDEERLPDFVAEIGPIAMIQHGDLAPRFVKLAPRLAREVTMRLETPVIYVHLPAGETQATFDLSVTFRGGVLSQFYPVATAVVDGVAITDPAKHHYRTLGPASTSSLTWSNIIAGGQGDGPPTDSPVWLAPRKVDSALLTVGDQRERYLFYRGLGHLDAPVQVSRSYDFNHIAVDIRPTVREQGLMTTLPDLWLADLRGDGTAAVRRVRATGRSTAALDDLFVDSDYSAAALAGLRQDLHAALVSDGLFTDEAHALLQTWEASYFKAAGQRLFFLVPRAWTDAHLPLTVSREATIVRSMIARIELVTPAQDHAIARLRAAPPSQPDWYFAFQRQQWSAGADGKPVWVPGGAERMLQLHRGESGVLAKLGLQVPEDYAAYLSLGRFRDTLIQQAIDRHPHPRLLVFQRTYLMDQMTMMLNANLAGFPSGENIPPLDTTPAESANR